MHTYFINISIGRDSYCVLKVDNEEVARCVGLSPIFYIGIYTALCNNSLFRTATVYHSSEPFWGEDYILHIPVEFQTVSVYVRQSEPFG